MSRKVCEKCGEINSSSAMYCVSCNASLNDAKVEEEVTTTTLRSNSSWTNSFTAAAGVSYGGWLLILFILGIPIVNFIVLIGMAIQGDNETLSNFGKAALTLSLVGIVLVVLTSYWF